MQDDPFNDETIAIGVAHRRGPMQNVCRRLAP